RTPRLTHHQVWTDTTPKRTITSRNSPSPSTPHPHGVRHDTRSIVRQEPPSGKHLSGRCRETDPADHVLRANAVPPVGKKQIVVASRAEINDFNLLRRDAGVFQLSAIQSAKVQLASAAPRLVDHILPVRKDALKRAQHGLVHLIAAPADPRTDRHPHGPTAAA